MINHKKNTMASTPEFITVQGDEAYCARCHLDDQKELGIHNLNAHLNDPALRHRHGQWKNPTKAEQEIRAAFANIPDEGQDGPALYELTIMAASPLLEDAYARIRELEERNQELADRARASQRQQEAAQRARNAGW